jgi:hypothetical protein
MNLGMGFTRSPARTKYTTKNPGVGEYDIRKGDKARIRNPMSYSIGKMKPHEILTPGGY